MPAIIDKIADALHLSEHKHDVPPSAAEGSSTPAFDHSKVTVLFVLGGPGAGKDTQCANLVKDFGFCHLSGVSIVAMEVAVKLLENAMRAALAENREGDGWQDGKGHFLIDGFPRKMGQALKFDQDVCLSSMVLFFTTTEEEMLKRLLERGKTSGREDDNEESIKKRFRVYKEQTMPVIEHYSKESKVATIDATATINVVHEKAKEIVGKIFAGEVGRNITA
ncbi:UMP-CMP kinase [Earliella scabrosa]|nr:UMP-CMP kinase [Earliella scabrosa]